ncbi:MAG: hypothetical protein OFPI_24050 [Osedax symbiont Rs2]|nr:MAG: hypothetical protein OFPI_24050 [Osedax symbiont Rs2]
MSSKSDEVLVTENEGSPGQRLQIAREALGISPKSIADDLFLPRNYILWIEEGAYEKLPSMVFCRGYIRAYAKAVNENGEELIELLDAVYGNHNIKAPLMSVSKIDEQVKVGDPVMKWSSLLFLLLLAGAVFWWWQTQYGLNAPFLTSKEPIAVETVNGNELVLPSLDDAAQVETTNIQLTVQPESAPVTNIAEVAEVAVAKPIQIETPPVTGNTQNVIVPVSQAGEVISNGSGIELTLNVVDEEAEALNNSELAALEQAVKTIEPETATSSAAPVVEAAVTEVTAALSVQILQMGFNDDCWVTIKDATGKTLFNGIKKSGELLSLSGETPLNVSIGRVNSISKITFAGTPIDLQAISRNNIANFRLPL